MEAFLTNAVLQLREPPAGVLQAVPPKRPREPAPAIGPGRGKPVLQDEERGAYLTSHGTVLSAEHQQELRWHLNSETHTGHLTRKKFMGNNVPRLSGAYADEDDVKYKYSGQTEVAKRWTDELRALKELVEEATGEKYNFALVNRYESLKDSVAWHADDEDVIIKNTSIASVSIGAAREFRYRRVVPNPAKPGKKMFPPKGTPESKIYSVVLQSGSLVEMRGTMQEHYYHDVPKRTPSAKNEEGVRYNITFRKVDLTLSTQPTIKKRK